MIIVINNVIKIKYVPVTIYPSAIFKNSKLKSSMVNEL